MSITNRKSSRVFQKKNRVEATKPLSKFQPGSGKQLKSKPTTTKKTDG